MAELPNNSRALYRICTKKSVIGFGKYADLTVGDVLKIDKQYIVYLYYSVPKFSLHQSILEELEMPAIPKPGTSDDALKAWNKAESAKYTEEERFHGYLKKRARIKRNAIGKLMRAKDATRFTKGQLQAINHGRGSGK